MSRRGFLRSPLISRPTRRRRKSGGVTSAIESLEPRVVLSLAGGISGYVYSDANDNGVFDAGETPLANVSVSLYDSNGSVVDTTVSKPDGSYLFDHDPRISTAPVTITQNASIAPTSTNFSKTMSFQQFDGSLGALTSVQIMDGGSITSTFGIENVDPTPTAVTSTVAGSLGLTGPGLNLNTVLPSVSRTDQLTAFDNVEDYGGTSGITFQLTTSGSNSTTLTNPATLALYSGQGTVKPIQIALANSTDTGPGNFDEYILTKASAQVQVIYQYTPSDALKPGAYTVVEAQPPGYLDGLETSGNVAPIPGTVGTDTIPITLGSNGSSNNNFGEVAPASVSGYVYADANNDGTFQGTESPIPGTLVTLSGSNDLGPIAPITVAADSNGFYQFPGLRPGSYSIVETQPSAYLDGKDTAGSGATSGSVSGNDAFAVSLSAGNVGTQFNFGELVPASIEGSVYFDANKSGTLDAGDSPISNVQVSLAGTDDLGNPVTASGSTDSLGNFAFAGLRPGTYTVTETQPAGYNEGTDAAGTAGGSTAVIDVTSGISLAAGQDAPGYLFGELGSSISGTVFYDANKSATLDAGDSGLGGLTVTLLDSKGQTVATTTTAGDGSYSFPNLPPGSYSVVETVKSGYGTDTPITLPVSLGASPVTGVNFGETLGSLSGVVYFDKDASGTLNTGDVDLGGVTVTLYNSSYQVVATTTTANDGSYSFSGLTAGMYGIVETQPAGYNQGTDTLGSVAGSSLMMQDVFVVPLGAGASGVNYNFGELGSSISGTVFYDANKSATLDAGDSGLGGLTVTLLDSKGQTVATTTTAADGSYNFPNLPPGSYSVVETVKSGYGTDTPTTLPVSLGTSPVTGVNFGETLGSLSGVVYFDKDASGTLNTGDVDLGGVTVTLYNGSSQVVATTTTANDGSYSFSGLTAGTYRVVETQPAGYNEGTDAAGTAGGSTAVIDVTSGISLAAGQDAPGYLFGELGSSISGTVFYDANKSTTLDAGDSGLGGLTVTLLDSKGQTVATTTTAADGSYNFPNLPPGSYSVVETVKSGYGTDTPITLPVSLGTSPVTGVNFGETLGSLSGVVYFDANGDGVQDNGETGISGVTVTLDDSKGNVLTTTLTNSSGGYSFGGLTAGTYSVVETQPSGYFDGLESINSTVQAGTIGTDTLGGIAVPAGTSVASYNFGEIAPGSLSGVVYFDANNNGSKDSGETGISGVTVTLTGTSPYGTVATQTTTTAADGSYSFTNLRPGTYTVTESQPSGYLDGLDAKNGAVIAGSYATDVVSGIGVVQNANSPNNNFGELKPGALSGYVYVDANDNGVKDSGETPIQGVSVTLTGTNDLGAITSATTTTAADGSYSFTNLRPGTYTVTETQPSGYLDGLDAKNGAVIAGSYATDVVSGIGVVQNSTAPNNNFGEVLPATVSGSVYVDANNNGTKDSGETPIQGVTVTLSGTNDLGALTSVTTTTDASGNYSFTGLRPGTYTVTETQPIGYLDGLDAKNGVPIAGSNTSDVISSLTVASGGTSANNNFGELKPGALSGYVYVDANDNGVKDSGETPIQGVSVTLTGTNDLGAITSATTTTAADGSYSFTGLRPGTYTVTETQPSGYLDGLDAKNGAVIAGSYATDVVSGIGVVQNATSPNNNFGELAPASLSGYVYFDANNNGVKDSGETPISGAKVTLTGTDDRGQSVSLPAATTDANGFYSFPNLRPGTYVLTETQPAGYADGKDAIGSEGGTTGNDVLTASPIAAGTSGINNNFGELLPITISGTTYLDTTGNGLTSDDKAFGGLTVTLYSDNNHDGQIDAGDTVVKTATSDATTGYYSFTNVSPGSYLVQETVPNNYLLTAPTNSPFYSVAATTLGATYGNNDFDQYMVCPCAGSVTSLSFVISGPEGTQTVTDLRGHVTQGDTVTAYFKITGTYTTQLSLVSYVAPGSSFDANTASQQTIYADSTGSFAPGPNSGTYSLTVHVPSSYFQVDFVCGQAIDQLGPAGSNIFYTPQGRLISADNGGSQAAGILSGYVYVDANDSGVRNATETGISGVTVTLQTASGTPIATTTTASDGSYSFSGLPSGTYTLVETQPSSYLEGKNTAGTAGGTAGAVGVDTISAITLNLAGGAVDGFEYDFGELRPAAVSGFAFLDSNSDGNRDTGESGLNNVTIKLTGTDDLGHAVSASTATASDGSYSFGGLRPGTYTVTETEPAGYTKTGNNVGTVNGSTDGKLSGSLAINSIALGSGNSGVEYDFGEIKFSSCTQAKPLSCGDTATIGYWANNNGQALIKSLNGGTSATNLATWLTSSYPNLFPASLNLKTNTDVAAYFVKLKNASGDKVEAQVMAVALATYVTDSDLAGTAASSYKFTVNSTGAGGKTYNTGSNGSAFGLSNNTNYTVLTFLQAANASASNGIVSGSTSSSARTAQGTIFNGINTAGDIPGG